MHQNSATSHRGPDEPRDPRDPSEPREPREPRGQPRKHHVVVLALPGVVLFDFSIPGQVFSREGGGRYQVTHCATQPGQVLSNLGVPLSIDHGLEALKEADTVIVPAYDRRPLPSQVRKALRDSAASGIRMASICAGSFALGDAGLLDNRPATTHWHHFDEFLRRFPTVQLDRRSLFVDDDSLITSAGLAAGLDVCLHLVRKDFGEAAGIEVSRHMVMPLARSGGQAQFIPGSGIVKDTTLSALCDWVDHNLSRTLMVEDLTRQALCSERSLHRMFHAAYQMSPMQWVTSRRIRHACTLLEKPELPIDTVAHQSGFGTPANLRLHFKRTFNTTPTAYRAAFCT